MLHGDVSMIDCQQTPATRLNSDAICNLCARLIDTYLVLCESCNDLSMASNYNCSVQVICLHCFCETNNDDCKEMLAAQYFLSLGHDF